MALQLKDKKKVLSYLNKCKKCAGFQHTDKCHESWKRRKAPVVQCNGTKENNNNYRCTCAWYMCNTHINQNKKTEENYKSKWEENITENKVHVDAMSHVKHEKPPEDENKTQQDLVFSVKL